MEKLVDITLHGDLGQKVGANWKLAVRSVAEAVRAINMNTRQSLYKYFYEHDKKGVRYKIVVNGDELEFDKEIAAEKVEDINFAKLETSELKVNRDIKTIDIVPVLEGSGGKNGGILAAILGVVLIVVGAVLIYFGAGPLGVGLIVAGIGLVASGVMVLLSKPPKFDDFRESDAYGRKKTSYLFDGPVNVTREGGPIPVGYGRLLIGSQVIQSDYRVNYVGANYYNTIKV